MNIIKRKEDAGDVAKAAEVFNASFGEKLELDEAESGYVTLDIDSNGDTTVLENLEEEIEQDRIIGKDYDFVVDHYDKYGGAFSYEGTVGPYTIGKEYDAIDHDGKMIAAGIHVYPNGKASLLFNGKDKWGTHFNETFEFVVEKDLNESLEEDPASETQKPFEVHMTLEKDEKEAVEVEVYAEDKEEATEKAEELYDGIGYDIKDIEETERHPIGDIEGASDVLEESMLTEDEDEVEIDISNEDEKDFAKTVAQVVDITELKDKGNLFLTLDEMPIGSEIKGVYRVADDSEEEVPIIKVADDAETAGYFWSFDGYPNRAIEDTIISILNNENATYMCYDYFGESLEDGIEVVEVEPSATEPVEEIGMSVVINDAINQENNLINYVSGIIGQLKEAGGKENIESVLESIIASHYEQVGKLQSCLVDFAPAAEAIDDGAEAVEPIINADGLVENYKKLKLTESLINYKGYGILLTQAGAIAIDRKGYFIGEFASEEEAKEFIDDLAEETNESLNEAVMKKLGPVKLTLEEDYYDDWLAHDSRYDEDITDDYEVIEDDIKIPCLKDKSLYLYDGPNGCVLSEDDIYYTEERPSAIEEFHTVDDAYDYIDVMKDRKEDEDPYYDWGFATEQDAIDSLGEEKDSYEFKTLRQSDGTYAIISWNKEEAIEESLKTLTEATHTYTVNFLDENEEIVDTFSLKNINTIRKRINQRMADEEALYDAGITSIEVDDENGESIFVAMQDAPEFDADGNIVAYGVWNIDQDDLDVAQEAELDDSERATVFNSVYSDLVAASDPSEIKLRRIKGRAPRYDYSEVGVDLDGNIYIESEDTEFARRVADEYGLSVVEMRNGVKLIIPEE